MSDQPMDRISEHSPDPGGPDAELVERMARAAHDRSCLTTSRCEWDTHSEYTRNAWREDVRKDMEIHGVPRAEQ